MRGVNREILCGTTTEIVLTHCLYIVGILLNLLYNEETLFVKVLCLKQTYYNVINYEHPDPGINDCSTNKGGTRALYLSSLIQVPFEHALHSTT